MGLEQVLISHFIKASRSSWHGERKKDGSRRIVDSSRWNCKMFEKRLSESRRCFRSIFFVRAKSGARNELSYFFFISFFLSFFLFVNYTLSETNVSPEWFFRSFFIKNRDYNHRINNLESRDYIRKHGPRIPKIHICHEVRIVERQRIVYISVKVSNVFWIYS